VPRSHNSSAKGAAPYTTKVRIPAVRLDSVAAMSSVIYNQPIAMIYMA
jgi:hypothetical protein